MKNPETIIRGIMKEAAASESQKIANLVGRHIKSKKPTAAEANKHFTHDEKAAEQIVKLAKSMEEQTELNEGSRYLYGINHTNNDAHKDIGKLADVLGYRVTGRTSKGTFKVYHGDRFITQISTDGGPAGNRRPIVDIHRHQMEMDGFRGDEHTIDSIRRSQRGLSEQTELEEAKSAAWQRSEGKDPEGGLNKKGVESYRRENPGSKLQTAVTTEPSKLKPGSKKAKRRLSFCRRMKGMKAKLTSAKTARDPDSRINKSLRKWNCE